MPKMFHTVTNLAVRVDYTDNGDSVRHVLTVENIMRRELARFVLTEYPETQIYDVNACVLISDTTASHLHLICTLKKTTNEARSWIFQARESHTGTIIVTECEDSAPGFEIVKEALEYFLNLTT